MTFPIKWHEESIKKHHQRDQFDCGDDLLNTFLKTHARQSHARGGSKTFLAIESDTQKVLGFYTLASASISYKRAPTIIKKNLARYEIPVFRLCKLAIDKPFQHQGLGGQLLLAAGKRCLCVAQQIGGVALLIDAKTTEAATWYKRYGALPLDDCPKSLLLSLHTTKRALAHRE